MSSLQGRTALAPLIFQFVNTPIVSVGLDVGKGDTVIIDNAEGIVEMVRHLVTVHLYRRFAFISGPTVNSEAIVRLNAFKGALDEREIPLPDTHVVYGTFTEKSGVQAVVELLDERNVDIKDIDAVVAANDEMDLGAMVELKQLGNIRSQ